MFSNNFFELLKLFTPDFKRFHFHLSLAMSVDLKCPVQFIHMRLTDNLVYKKYSFELKLKSPTFGWQIFLLEEIVKQKN